MRSPTAYTRGRARKDPHARYLLMINDAKNICDHRAATIARRFRLCLYPHADRSQCDGAGTNERTNTMGIDTLTFSQTLERAGFHRRQADAIAHGMGNAAADLVTKADLDAAMDRLVIRLAGFVAAGLAISTAVLGVLVSLN